MNAIPQLHDYLETSAARLPDKIALVCGERRITYGELEANANALAHALVRRGVGRRDRVVVFLDNTVEAVIAFWGVSKASAIVVMQDPHAEGDALARVLNDCRAAALVTDARHAAAATEAVPRCKHLRSVIVAGEFDVSQGSGACPWVRWDAALGDEDVDAPPPRRGLDVDLASILYVDAGGVMLTHRNMLSASASMASYLGNGEDDVILSASALAVDNGLYPMITAFMVGARFVLASPDEVLGQLVAEEVTGFPGIPSLFVTLAEVEGASAFAFPSLRYVTNTAGVLEDEHLEALKRVFPAARIVSTYGVVECTSCTYLPPDDLAKKPGSVGVAIPNTEVWIVDQDDRRMGPNVVGQLVVRGATVMRGYWDKPDPSSVCLRSGPLAGEVVLYTGEDCLMDPDGYVYFVGRTDDPSRKKG